MEVPCFLLKKLIIQKLILHEKGKDNTKVNEDVKLFSLFYKYRNGNTLVET